MTSSGNFFLGQPSETPPPGARAWEKQSAQLFRSERWNLATWDLAYAAGSSETTASAPALHELSLARRKFEHRFDAFRTPPRESVFSSRALPPGVPRFLSRFRACGCLVGVHGERLGVYRKSVAPQELRSRLDASCAERRLGCHGARAASLRARVVAYGHRGLRVASSRARARSLPLLRVSLLADLACSSSSAAALPSCECSSLVLVNVLALVLLSVLVMLSLALLNTGFGHSPRCACVFASRLNNDLHSHYRTQPPLV